MITAAWLFGIGGAVLVGIGAFFLFARPALLPEDLRHDPQFRAERQFRVLRCLPLAPKILQRAGWPMQRDAGRVAH